MTASPASRCSRRWARKYWPTYFRTLHDRLKPGKSAVLQVITVAEERWERYRKTVDFIQKFIFPGGMLPTASRLQDEGRKAGLAFRDAITFGEGYSLTLRRWRETFTARWTTSARWALTTGSAGCGIST